MDERIKELAKQAGIYQPERFDGIDGSNQLEKFAELIVQRCAELSDLAEDNDLHGSTIIKRHFGVDE